MRLDDPITSIKGVGDKVALLLSRLGVKTVGDILLNFPRDYNDYSNLLPINDLEPGLVTVRAKVESVSGRYVRRGMHITEAVIADESGKVKAVWFNQPYLSKSLPKGQELYFSGVFELAHKGLSIQNPVWEKADELTKSTARIVPVYKETKGITSRQIRNIVFSCLPALSEIENILPNSLDIQSRSESIKALHFPESKPELNKAREYMGYEELFSLICASQLSRREHNSFISAEIDFNQELTDKFLGDLGFELTNAQRKASWQIIQDMQKPRPMNRLLQGDVGSGKTLVAGMAALQAVAAGYQVAVIVPTEILARQHAKSIQKIFSSVNYRVEMLIGGPRNKIKQTLIDECAEGQIDIVIGTHALLEKTVNFKSLGLVVIDEQHRFGVKQREKLQVKSDKMPHLLSMTATPIPRSMALTVYGDLDISVIDEMPKGRKAIKSSLVRQTNRQKIYDDIEIQIKSGRQVYVVCPLIDESDSLGIKSVTAEYEILQKSVFKNYKIELLHGKLKSDEKESIMQAFSEGKIDILVSTTVVEVGVDVPNATVMLIEGAERFGLAQLHQLRGRVGRSDHQSYCYLAPSNDKYIGKRLRAVAATHDGFKLAELDMELRGPGVIYGTRQHGQLDLRFAQLSDTKLIAEIQKRVIKFLDSEDLSLYPELMKRIVAARSITQLN